MELLIVQTPLLSTLRMFLARLRRRAASDGNLWNDSAVKYLVHTRVELLIVQTPLLSTLCMFLARLRQRAASDGNLWKEKHL